MVNSFFQKRGIAREERLDQWLEAPERSWRERLKENDGNAK